MLVIFPHTNTDLSLQGCQASKTSQGLNQPKLTGQVCHIRITKNHPPCTCSPIPAYRPVNPAPHLPELQGTKSLLSQTVRWRTKCSLSSWDRASRGALLAADTPWPMPELCSLCCRASNAVQTPQPPARAESSSSTVRLLGTPPDPAAAAPPELPGQPPPPALPPAATAPVTQTHSAQGQRCC